MPGSFRLDEAGSTVALDGGRVLVGGSPLRLLRLSARGRDLVGRWKAGRPVGAQRAARLLARRLVTSEVYVPWPGPSMLHPDDVTVVVPVRDRPAQLDRVLGTLGSVACVVVDDASHDAPSTKAIAKQHGARFIGLDTNVGPAGARNAGLAEVHSTLVAFVDSDCILADGWLEPLLGHFDDPLVAAVAPRIVPHRDTPHDALARYQRVRSSLDRGPVAGLVRPGGPIPFVPSAALLVRADVAEGADLFDPSLRGGEDVDLVWRLTEAGWDVRYEPASAVEHEGPATFGAFLSRQAFYGSTAAPLARRHPGALAPVRVSGWSLAVWALALARRPALAASALALSSAILAARLDGLVRDPVAVATRIAGGGTVRAAVPALGGAAPRGPLRWWPAWPSAAPAGPRCWRSPSPPWRPGPPTATVSTRHDSSRCTSPTTRRTAPACGRGPCALGRSSRWSPASAGVRGSGPGVPSARLLAGARE